MTFWLIMSLMTAIAAAAMIWPLYRPIGNFRSHNEFDVYRDQLAEIERDKAVGLIGTKEAQAAKVEVSRRLLAAGDLMERDLSAAVTSLSPFWRRVIAVIAVLVLPAGAGGLYLRLGSPGLASEPSASQLNSQSEQQSIETMVAKVEAHLDQTPDDGRAWEILGPVYIRLGRYTDSVNAWNNTLRLLGETSERYANLGEALVAEANGVVTADAKAAFARAVALDSKSISARYYLGVAAEQDGRPDEAIKIWRELIAAAPTGEHWVSDVRESIARLESKSAATPSDRSAGQLTAPVKEPQGDQAAMIRAMVDRLAARLKQDGSDVDGWVRLVRSYKVLREPDQETAASAAARQALASDPAKLQQLNASLKELDASNSVALSPIPSVAATVPNHQSEEDLEASVDRLAQRLKKSRLDPAGWLMLTRSYLTLGEKEKANIAIEGGRRALADDPNKLAQFNEALKNFKIGE